MFKVGKAISNKNVKNAKFNPAPFEGAFKASLGRPELKGSWLIFGGSGAGKTTFALQLAKYLTNFVDKVAFDSLEQGLSLSLQKTWNRVGMEEVGAKVILLDKEGLPELRERLTKRKSPNVVFIDSVICLIGLRMADYQRLLNDFPNKLFVFLAHEDDKGKPYPAIAEKIRKLSDIKMHVEGYKVFTTTRLEDRDKGEGGEDFVIWEEGAAEYSANIE